MIVIGCATENLILLAIFMSRERLDIKAMANWTAFMPINLVVCVSERFPVGISRVSPNIYIPHVPFWVIYGSSILLCCTWWYIDPPVYD